MRLAKCSRKCLDLGREPSDRRDVLPQFAGDLRRDTLRGKRRKRGNAATHPSYVPRGSWLSMQQQVSGYADCAAES